MSKQTLKFNDIVVSKNDFCASKKAIPLSSVNTNKRQFLTELNIMTTVINILLVIYMMMT